MINDLKEFIAIDSTLAPKSSIDAPFGKNLRNVLDLFLNKASSYGLKVGEDNGFYGWADYGDPNKPIIGILCHADIVPCGEGWDTNPLELAEKDGVLYGRGVADDKGALAVMLHLLKRFKEEKLSLNHRVRLIVGLNEESGSACIKRYAKYQEIPRISLVPDADFPVINSEKGILHSLCTMTLPDAVKQNIFAFNAGQRANIVPDRAEFVVSEAYYNTIVSSVSNQMDFSVKKIDEHYHFVVTGVSGHASAPNKCDNAIFKAIYLLSFADEFFAQLYKNACSYSCNLYNSLWATDKSGDLTFNIGVATLDNVTLSLIYDFRLPLCVSKKAVCSTLEKYYQSVTIIQYSPNLFIPEDTPLIKTLLSVYRSITRNNRAKPLQIGGGTYARELPNAVAFGPTFSGRETNIHNRNECIPLSDLIKLSEIYYKAIIELDKLI